MPDTPSDTPPPSDAPPGPAAPASATSAEQSGVDSLVNQMQAGDALATEAAQAVAQAAQTASEIIGDIHAADSAAPGRPPLDAIEDSIPIPSAATSPLSEELRQLLAIEVPVIVQLGVRRMTVGEVMRLSVGAIVEFQKAADEELDLLASNKPIGKGHAVKVGENFGIKLTSIAPVKETIRILGST